MGNTVVSYANTVMSYANTVVYNMMYEGVQCDIQWCTMRYTVEYNMMYEGVRCLNSSTTNQLTNTPSYQLYGSVRCDVSSDFTSNLVEWKLLMLFESPTQ
jgi:hypothetical protein